jgi:hypothetical protein
VYCVINFEYTVKINNWITPWSRILPEKLSGPQLLKKSPAFYTARRFITAFTTARHLSLSWTRSDQSVIPSYFSQIHFNIMLPSASRSSKWSTSLRFSHQNPVSASTHTVKIYYKIPHAFPVSLFELSVHPILSLYTEATEVNPLYRPPLTSFELLSFPSRTIH